MFVKNKSELLDLGRDQKEKEHISKIIDLTDFILEEAQPSKMMTSSIILNEEMMLSIYNDNFTLNQYEHLYLIAFGKASQKMLKWLVQRLPLYFSRIILVSPDSLDEFFKTTSNLVYFQGGHPKPTEESVRAAEDVITLLEKTTKNDLCIFLVSGGGSALLEKPDYGIELTDYQQLVELLLSSNASIHEINAIRKHFSAIKGGKLAQQTKAQVVSLILSDVLGNDISSIASGPTAPDKTTWEDCNEIFINYSLMDKLPESISSILIKGLNHEIKDTPAEEGLFKHIKNYIIGDNTKLLKIINKHLSKLGFSEIIDARITGESSQVGEKFALQAILDFENLKDDELTKPQFMVFGGETTVTLKSFKGRGGRNQELALSFALNLKENIPLYLLSMGTDGIDGNSKAAGAIVGPFTIDTNNKKTDAKKYLTENDTNTFFKKYGGELVTGYSGTNLMDIGIIIYYPSA